MSTDNVQEQEAAIVLDDLAERVRDALEHFYDFRYLQKHPLVWEGAAPAAQSAQGGWQRLRQDLASAIESLSPGPAVSFRAPQARLHSLLVLRYLEGATVQEAAHKLGISRRQAHRDLQRAIRNVAAILMARRSTTTPPERQVTQLSSVRAEIDRLVARSTRVDLRELVQSAQHTVAPLAAEREITFQLSMPLEPVTVSTNQVMAEQVVVNALSQAVRQARPGPVQLIVTADEGQAVVTLSFYCETQSSQAPMVGPVAEQLAGRLGWRIGQADDPRGLRTIEISVIPLGPTVLVIDDNAGLVELLQRYLTDQACRVVAAADGQDGLQMAQEMPPDAIVLDIMMPGMHGWDVLQRLRMHPKTADIPVIICSVINDPDLAHSLGASLILAKPISRSDVLTALHELGVV
jgi:CheY-like chemotaxis protein/signal transduction histidine kinase